jgi:hypothetical protein
VAVVVVVAAVGGTYLVARRSAGRASVAGQEGAAGQAQQTAEEKAAHERMLLEIKKAAEATPAPTEPDPSDLPSIDDVLAEDDAGADEPDAASGGGK